MLERLQLLAKMCPSAVQLNGYCFFCWVLSLLLVLTLLLLLLLLPLGGVAVAVAVAVAFVLTVAVADSCRMGLCERRTLKQGVQFLDEIPSQPRLRPTKASSQPRLGWLWHLFWRSASAFFTAALARVA